MGRRLTALENDDTSITYVYDASGQRVSKTVNGVTTEFYYDDRGSLILSSRSDGTDIYFYPDADGSIGSINYGGVRYYYVRNAQNDVIGITDKTGAFVARYTYDEWGNITSITDGNGNDVSVNPNHIANLNPLRYRSYFYDTETGWYWLNTRYYDPSIGRFINADGYASTGQGVLGHNMFAYCGNNPVSFGNSKNVGHQTQSTEVQCGPAGQLDASGTSVTMLDRECKTESVQTVGVINTGSGISNSNNIAGGNLILSFRDVTVEENKALSLYIQEAQKIAQLVDLVPIYEPYRYGIFGLLVNHGAAWDIKNRGPWESTIGTQFPGQNSFIVFQGLLLTPENLGNYTYGCLGAAFGLSYQTLIDGSVFAALTGNRINNSSQIQNEVGDWDYIRLGWFMYYFLWGQ